MRLKLSILHNAGPEWKVSNVDVRRVDDGTAAIRVSAELPYVEATYKPGSQKVAMMLIDSKAREVF